MDTISRKCPVCGTEYQANPSRLKQRRNLACSLECSYKLRSGKRVERISRLCATCGKPVEKLLSQMGRCKHGSVFCSRACHYAGRSLGVTRRVVSQPYTYTAEGKARMIEASKKLKGRRAFHILTCLNCGKEFDDANGGRERKSGLTFCSLDCCNTYRKGENNPAWRGGHPKYYGPDWRAARRATWKRDDYRCRRCGVKPRNRPDVHHIIPVGSFPNPNDAHYLENLVSLCHSCHMFVEWNGMDFEV
jgi:DNA-directed RNA polymerase subunit RPC12/RpoP